MTRELCGLLVPCRCGNKTLFIMTDTDGTKHVYCSKDFGGCGKVTDYFNHKKDCVKYWNEIGYTEFPNLIYGGNYAKG